MWFNILFKRLSSLPLEWGLNVRISCIPWTFHMSQTYLKILVTGKGFYYLFRQSVSFLFSRAILAWISCLIRVGGLGPIFIVEQESLLFPLLGSSYWLRKSYDVVLGVKTNMYLGLMWWLLLVAQHLSFLFQLYNFVTLPAALHAFSVSFWSYFWYFMFSACAAGYFVSI